MASSQEINDDVDGEVPGYKPPAEKSLEEIMAADAEDESLRRYKEQLLGSAAIPTERKKGEKNIQIKEFGIVIGTNTIASHELDTAEKIEQFKSEPMVVPEGATFKIQIKFKVGFEIVSGLKCITTLKRVGLKTKFKHMMGSYAPKAEYHTFTTGEDVAPSGVVGRGKYECETEFVDDDNHKHLTVNWILKIGKK